jgi:hypothetical protein
MNGPTMLDSERMDLPTQFDVRAEDRRLLRAERPARAAATVGSLALIAFGVVLGFTAFHRQDWVVFGIGAAALLGGVYFLANLYRAYRLRVRRIVLSQEGTSLSLANSTNRPLRWDDPKLRIVLNDYRANTIYGMRAYVGVPCALTEAVEESRQRRWTPFEASRHPPGPRWWRFRRTPGVARC